MAELDVRDDRVRHVEPNRRADARGRTDDARRSRRTGAASHGRTLDGNARVR
jgi:hypothetical protein